MAVIGRGAPSAEQIEAGDWARWALAAIGVVTLVKIGLNALGFAPIHFDESQYWTYGEALAWGYYSKPPMVAWLIRLSTEIFGDTAFGVRFFAPLLHGAIAWAIFATGRRLFEGRTGFWAAVVYLASPGVTVSSGVMSTDPPMMLAWALALYALVRALEAEGPEGRTDQSRGWWLALGLAVGAGLLSKYTIVAFVGGALGYALFARQAGPIWRAPPEPRRLIGPGLAALAALAVFSPNLFWNAANDFASIAHVGDNAKLGDGAAFSLAKLGEFLGAQLGVFGPVSFGLLAAFALLGRWRHEWPFRLLLWLSLPLLVAMILQAFLSRAHPNWAAPSYIAGAILVAAWALDLGRRGLLIAIAAIGLLAGALFHGLAGVYAGGAAAQMPRAFDPFKKTRHYHAICARALALRDGRRLFAHDRRLAADCLWGERLDLSQLRLPPTRSPGNHYALVASLDPAGAAAREETFLLVFRGPPEQARGVLRRFEVAEVLEEGAVRTHQDRLERYTLAAVKGWRG